MTRHLLLAVAVLIGLPALCACSSDSHETVYAQLAAADKGWSTLSDYERGKRYLEVHDYGLAIQSFSADLERDPKSIASLNGLAIAYDRLGRVDVAENYFNQALAVDPNSAVTLSNMAYYRMTHGDTKTAAELFERASASLAPGTWDRTHEEIASALHNNKVALARLAAEHDASTATAVPVPQPPIERLNDKEWAFHGSQSPAAAPAAPAQAAPQADVAAPRTRIDVVNASGRWRMARHIGHFLARRGVAVGRLLNAQSFGRARSVLFFRTESRQSAETVNGLLPVRVRLIEVRRSGQAMELVAGHDLDAFDRKIAEADGGATKVAER